MAPTCKRPRGVTVSTLDSESSDRGSNPREAFFAKLRESAAEISSPASHQRCRHPIKFFWFYLVSLYEGRRKSDLDSWPEWSPALASGASPQVFGQEWAAHWSFCSRMGRALGVCSRMHRALEVFGQAWAAHWSFCSSMGRALGFLVKNGQMSGLCCQIY